MILVTGATGFLGEWVVRELIDRGSKPICFVRHRSRIDNLQEWGISVRVGDLRRRKTLAESLVGVKTLVSLASLGKGHTDHLIEEAEAAGVERAVFVSTTGIFTSLEPESKVVRINAEKRIVSSRLTWTILRPTMIYGTQRDRNVARLLQFLSRSPIVPIPGPGKYLVQPVHVSDVARAVVDVLENPVTYGKAYNLSGREPLTFRELITKSVEALGCSTKVVPIPTWMAVPLVAAYERLARKPRLKVEQLQRLNENKAFSHKEASRDFGFAPMAFEDGVRAEIGVLQAEGYLKSKGRP